MVDIDYARWRRTADYLAKPYAPRFARGPWNGRDIAPQLRRTARVHIEPLAPRITDLDYEAYMGSIEHIRRSYATGGRGEPWPTPDITPSEASRDLHSCWARFGRGEAFQFAALTHDRGKEIGCAYLTPTADGDDPYETALTMWTIESAVAQDLDRHLLEAMLEWIDEEWDFERVVYYVPRAYGRGLEVARAAGLREADRRPPQPRFACFGWDASSHGR